MIHVVTASGGLADSWLMKFCLNEFMNQQPTGLGSWLSGCQAARRCSVRDGAFSVCVFNLFQWCSIGHTLSHIAPNQLSATWAGHTHTHIHTSERWNSSFPHPFLQLLLAHTLFLSERLADQIVRRPWPLSKLLICGWYTVCVLACVCVCTWDALSLSTLWLTEPQRDWDKCIQCFTYRELIIT